MMYIHVLYLKQNFIIIIVHQFMFLSERILWRVESDVPMQCCLWDKAMPNRNFVKRQLKFDKPMYLFTKTQTENENTFILRQKQCII